jgi:integrase
MKATLRNRPVAGGKLSLYLDIYPPAPHPETGKFTRKYALGMTILEKPRTAAEREANKATLALATSVQAKIQLKLQAQEFGFLVREKQVLLAPLMEAEATRARTNAYQYTRALELLQEAYGEGVTIQSMTSARLREFRTLLLERYSTNSAAVYFVKLRQVLRKAHDEGLLASNPLKSVENIPIKPGPIIYLDQDEIMALIKTECKNPDLKKAFLLSIETGLRRCDVEIITGEAIHMTDEGPEVRITQKKTGRTLTIPITIEMYRYLGLPKEGRLFRHVASGAYNGELARWTKAAGINKPITFHTARHTCATQLIAHDVHLRTTQDILGHKNIRSTLIYAHVIDKSKREAIEKKKIIGTGME